METLIIIAEAAKQNDSSTGWFIAMLGGFGVIVGAVITMSGQAATRRAERRNEIEKLAADMAGSSYLLQASFSGLTNYLALDPSQKSQVVGDKHTDPLNIEMDRTLSLGNQLSIRAPQELRHAAIYLVNACVKAQEYLHPVHGTGLVEQYKYADAFLENIANNREFMIDEARSIHPRSISERIRGALAVLRKKPESA